MTKAEIQRGLEQWADRMAGARQFDKWLARREKERAAEAKKKQ